MKSRLVALILGVGFILGADPSLLRADALRHDVHSRTEKGAHASRSGVFPGPRAGGLHEEVEPRYKKRFERWKKEFLSTDIGRMQWDMYARHSHLTLTITVAADNKRGAGSGNYKWNDAGELVSATIVLGSRIDEGYPSSIYYPVMNALEPYESARLLSRNVLAATKIAHELGHVMRISETPEAVYRLQAKLVPIYNKIFLSNGHNVNDPRLVDLAKQMGGNPVQIWEDREYWGEANAMLYLRDRVAKETFHCRIFNKIKRSVELFAKPYEERFTEIAKSQGVIYSCSWK